MRVGQLVEGARMIASTVGISAETLARLELAQEKFIDRRDAEEMAGRGGSSRIGPKVIAGGFFISYNGRVWKGEPGSSNTVLVLE